MTEITKGPDSSMATQIAGMQIKGREASTERITAQLKALEGLQQKEATTDTDLVLSRLADRAAKDASKLKDRSNIKKLIGAHRAARLKPIGQIKQSADQLSKRNPELKLATLEMLWEKVQPGDSKEVILQKVLASYPNPKDADDALEFLLDTTEGELREAVQAAKDDLNADHGENIQAAREEIAPHDDTPLTLSSWEDIRKFLSNQPDSLALFTKLEEAGSFKEQKPIIAKLLHQVGEQLKTKGEGIEKGELNDLMKQTRFLQTHLGVYTLFRNFPENIRNEINRYNNINYRLNA